MFEVGEKIHVVERRLFEGDVRRHFVGQVEHVGDGRLRVTGHTFVFNADSGTFTSKPEVRTRVVPLTDARLVINVIPQDVDLDAVTYEWTAGNHLVVRDRSGWSLEMDEFGSPR